MRGIYSRESEKGGGMIEFRFILYPEFKKALGAKNAIELAVLAKQKGIAIKHNKQGKPITTSTAIDAAMGILPPVSNNEQNNDIVFKD